MQASQIFKFTLIGCFLIFSFQAPLVEATEEEETAALKVQLAYCHFQERAQKQSRDVNRRYSLSAKQLSDLLRGGLDEVDDEIEIELFRTQLAQSLQHYRAQLPRIISDLQDKMRAYRDLPSKDQIARYNLRQTREGGVKTWVEVEESEEAEGVHRTFLKSFPYFFWKLMVEQTDFLIMHVNLYSNVGGDSPQTGLLKEKVREISELLADPSGEDADLDVQTPIHYLYLLANEAQAPWKKKNSRVYYKLMTACESRQECLDSIPDLLFNPSGSEQVRAAIKGNLGVSIKRLGKFPFRMSPSEELSSMRKNAVQKIAELKRAVSEYGQIYEGLGEVLQSHAEVSHEVESIRTHFAKVSEALPELLKLFMESYEADRTLLEASYVKPFGTNARLSRLYREQGKTFQAIEKLLKQESSPEQIQELLEDLTLRNAVAAQCGISEPALRESLVCQSDLFGQRVSESIGERQRLKAFLKPVGEAIQQTSKAKRAFLVTSSR